MGPCTACTSICMEVNGGTIGATEAHTRQVIDARSIDSGSHFGQPPSQGYQHLKGLIRDVHVKANAQVELDPIWDTGETHADVVRCLAEDGYEGMMTIEHWWDQGARSKVCANSVRYLIVKRTERPPEIWIRPLASNAPPSARST